MRLWRRWMAKIRARRMVERTGKPHIYVQGGVEYWVFPTI